MPIQDDVREDVLIAQFGLIKYSSHSRGEFDASDHNNNKFELKSTTTNTVSTARDFSDKHIIKWRKQYFIIGQWDESVAQYKRIYFLAPIHMSKWLNAIEYKVNQRKDIATRVMNANVVYAEERKTLRKMLSRGCTFNCPPIPLRYIETNGIPLYNTEQLITLVNQYPIEASTTEQGLSQFFT